MLNTCAWGRSHPSQQQVDCCYLFKVVSDPSITWQARVQASSGNTRHWHILLTKTCVKVAVFGLIKIKINRSLPYYISIFRELNTLQRIWTLCSIEYGFIWVVQRACKRSSYMYCMIAPTDELPTGKKRSNTYTVSPIGYLSSCRSQLGICAQDSDIAAPHDHNHESLGWHSPSCHQRLYLVYFLFLGYFLFLFFPPLPPLPPLPILHILLVLPPPVSASFDLFYLLWLLYLVYFLYFRNRRNMRPRLWQRKQRSQPR